MRSTVLAPAKVNLCLHVLGKRDDGYHDLSMLMQRVSLYDRIDIELNAAPGVRVACAGLALAEGEENIAGRAARRMLELAGSGQGVDIVIDKQIPVAAGLGGGSSDAAAVLVTLDRMLELKLGKKELMAEGARLGADVPFFVFEQTAWATGIGDELEVVEGLPDLWYVLVNPGVSVSTAWVYGNLGLTSKSLEAKLPRFFETARDVVGLLHNDLEPVTVGRHPVVSDVKERLLGSGALGALMSGSGPTVFGVFEDEGAARKAAGCLADAQGWKVFVVRSL